jgi:hypothetical protein
MFEKIKNDIYGVFASPQWKAKSIPSYPDNYVGETAGPPYVKVNILPGRSDPSGYAGKGINGILLLEIYVVAGDGDTNTVKIADTLNGFFEGKTLTNGTQFGTSLLKPVGKVPNSPLYRTDYAIIFKIYGDL